MLNHAFHRTDTEYLNTYNYNNEIISYNCSVSLTAERILMKSEGYIWISTSIRFIPEDGKRRRLKSTRDLFFFIVFSAERVWFVLDTWI